MTKESKDEEYLDSLLNSITEGNEISSDFDKWFEDELNNIDDVDFENELNQIEDSDVDIDDDINDEDDTESFLDTDSISVDDFSDIPEASINEELLDTPQSSDNEKLTNMQESSDNEEFINTSELPVEEKFSNEPLSEADMIPSISEDNNDIHIEDVVDDKDEDIDDLMKFLDEYDDSDEKEDKNADKTDEDDVQFSTDDSTNLSNKDNNESENIREDNDYSEKINNDNDDSIVLNEATEEAFVEKSDSAAKEKTKKKSFLAKLFSKKNSTTDLNDIDADEILAETGSTLDDMSDFSTDIGLNDETSDLFGDLDNIDDLPEAEPQNKKNKKEKKEKVKKEKKPRKEKKIKPQKEKRIRRDEIIHISPLCIILMLTIISLFVLSTYFGSGAFSYNRNITKATSYYVDKEYTKAYDILSGMDVKKSDSDFYKQVENVMQVEKNINDFNSFITIEKYVYALEALLKGISDYDKNVENAKKLGTYNILEDEMSKIDTFLKNYYGLSVNDARELLKIDNKSEFEKVINDKAANVSIPNAEGNE